MRSGRCPIGGAECAMGPIFQFGFIAWLHASVRAWLPAVAGTGLGIRTLEHINSGSAMEHFVHDCVTEFAGAECALFIFVVAIDIPVLDHVNRDGVVSGTAGAQCAMFIFFVCMRIHTLGHFISGSFLEHAGKRALTGISGAE